jgi:hypothetical protein
MAAAIEITREDWARETERLCPSGLAYSAYVALEQFIVEDTDLKVTYESVQRGKSAYATFHATAGEKLSIAQVYKGQCQLNWKVKPNIAGLSEVGKGKVEQAFDAFRETLDGKEGKGWETVKVLRLGEETVLEAVKKVAEDLCDIFNSDKDSRVESESHVEAEHETEEAAVEAVPGA